MPRLMMRSPVFFAAVLAMTAAPALSAQDEPSPADLAAGERLFESQCVRCHGVGGTGGVAPALTRPTLRRAPDDAALTQVILAGIPGTAMIGFWNFSAEEAAQVAQYVRALGRRPPEVLPGDPLAGRRLYEERGQCGSCHILDGQGAGWAPDLSDVGLRLRGAQLRAALIEPATAQPISALPSVHGPYPAFLAVSATTATGRVIEGTRITEDDFTIVIREPDGRLRSLDKTRLRRLVKSPGRSPMPSYAGVFTQAELDDLVAYLASRRGEP